MHVRVEMLGLSRLVTGEREVSLELDDEATYRDLVRALSARYPALIGNVIQSDRESLQAPNIFNLNAKHMIQSKQMANRLADELQPSDSYRIILMSMSAGG
jgi:molybdopterin converting factor small subunit